MPFMPAFALTVWGASFVLLWLCEYEWDTPEPSDQQEYCLSSRLASSRSDTHEKENLSRHANEAFKRNKSVPLPTSTSSKDRHYAPKLDLEAVSPPYSLAFSHSDLSADDDHLNHLTLELLDGEMPTSYVSTSSISSRNSSSSSSFSSSLSSFSSSPMVSNSARFTRTRPAPISTALPRTRLIRRRP
eukprot:g47184.t1